MSWTEERVETLKTLWMQRKTATEIAAIMGESLTRNAVIGKVHRLNLEKRMKPIRKTSTKLGDMIKAKKQVASAAPKLERTMKPMVSEQGTASVLTLGVHMCKWPIGDPFNDDFSFCGLRQNGAGPYCAKHAKKAYVPALSDPRSLARTLRRYL
jgi:GcrA cell cycle regulator